MADRNGYIGRAPSDSAVTVARQTFSPTGVTTNFTFASGYVAGYFDIFINGVKMIEGSDYTSTDGSTFSVLNGGVTNGDVIEGVAYKAFNAATATVGIYSGGDPISTQANILNFVGTGNTFALRGSTVDISISGGGAGAGGTWTNYDTNTGVSTTKKVKIENNLEVTGVTTSTGGFVGNVTGNASGTAGGLTGTPDITVRNITGVAATFTGVLTYEDVTNVDSVGLVTARTGVRVVGGGLTVTGVSTFFGGIDLPDSPASPNARITIGDGANPHSEDAQIYHNSTYGTVFQDTTNTGIQIWTGGTGGIKGQNGTDFIVKTNGGARNVELYSGGSLRLTTTGAGVTVAGIITATGGVQVGSGQSFGANGPTAVYYGDGSNLTGISAGITTTKYSPTANAIIQIGLGTAQHHELTLTAGFTTITTSGGSFGDSHSLVLIQPSSGIATVGFSTFFQFPSGATPSMSEGSSKVDLVSFVVKDVTGNTGTGATELLASAGLNYS